MKHAPNFFWMMRERERIRISKEAGLPAPWTEDKVLQSHRFCNVFREDDKTTRWFRDHLREPLRNNPRVLFATVAFRWFNKIETGEQIVGLLGQQSSKDVVGFEKDRYRERLAGRKPLVTGAYIIKTPDGLNKLEGILQCLDIFQSIHEHPLVSACAHGALNLEAAHKVLMDCPYLGRFMAYEVVTDLRHTYLLEGADDIQTWTSFGPGAARGMGWINYNDPTTYGYTSNHQQTRMLGYGQELLAMSRNQQYWPQEWRGWEMREVEHGLCEYDKYRRGLNGGRLKRKYP